MSIPSQGNFYDNGGLESREVPSGTTCNICMDPIVDAVATPCPCNMVFCREHIREWLDSSAKCPTCRTRFFYFYPPGALEEKPDETYQDIIARVDRQLIGPCPPEFFQQQEYNDYINFRVAWNMQHARLSDAEQESMLPPFVCFDADVLDPVIVRLINREIFSETREGRTLSREMENWLFEAGRSFLWLIDRETKRGHHRAPVEGLLGKIIRDVSWNMDFEAARDAREESGQEDIPEGSLVRHHVPAELAEHEASLLEQMSREIIRAASFYTLWQQFGRPQWI